MLKKIFGSKSEPIPERTLDEIKNICKIVFIDDRAFPIIDILKNSNWKNVTRLRDVASLSQTEIVEGHILFVDIQGVGKKLKLEDEGLGLIVALKKKYPHKRVIAYSSEDEGQVQAFHEGINVADSRLSKNAATYQFEFLVEKYAKEAFSMSECIERIKGHLTKELGNSPETNEIITKLNKINAKNDFSPSIISKHFNLQNASSLASIVQLFLKG
ncbi:hypothetical protein CW751_07225 [Brumimicrobium salinarum]|uniref:Response regulator n=1 Tax=Brumimicrobium salinarum TaxID=2058658 RepID=A0A2I0R3G8_9FLAO|nr:hypothetical protein [Brumimicrobium salinarum]PKR80950.1 hypothetical protein CW751_07225 [Brumimicrobium salinarum]